MYLMYDNTFYNRSFVHFSISKNLEKFYPIKMEFKQSYNDFKRKKVCLNV